MKRSRTYSEQEQNEKEEQSEKEEQAEQEENTEKEKDIEKEKEKDKQSGSDTSPPAQKRRRVVKEKESKVGQLTKKLTQLFEQCRDPSAESDFDAGAGFDSLEYVLNSNAIGTASSLGAGLAMRALQTLNSQVKRQSGSITTEKQLASAVAEAIARDVADPNSDIDISQLRDPAYVLSKMEEVSKAAGLMRLKALPANVVFAGGESNLVCLSNSPSFLKQTDEKYFDPENRSGLTASSISALLGFYTNSAMVLNDLQNKNFYLHDIINRTVRSMHTAELAFHKSAPGAPKVERLVHKLQLPNLDSASRVVTTYGKLAEPYIVQMLESEYDRNSLSCIVKSAMVASKRKKDCLQSERNIPFKSAMKSVHSNSNSNSNVNVCTPFSIRIIEAGKSTSDWPSLFDLSGITDLVASKIAQRLARVTDTDTGTKQKAVVLDPRLAAKTMLQLIAELLPPQPSASPDGVIMIEKNAVLPGSSVVHSPFALLELKNRAQYIKTGDGQITTPKFAMRPRPFVLPYDLPQVQWQMFLTNVRRVFYVSYVFRDRRDAEYTATVVDFDKEYIWKVVRFLVSLFVSPAYKSFHGLAGEPVEFQSATCSEDQIEIKSSTSSISGNDEICSQCTIGESLEKRLAKLKDTLNNIFTDRQTAHTSRAGWVPALSAKELWLGDESQRILVVDPRPEEGEDAPLASSSPASQFNTLRLFLRDRILKEREREKEKENNERSSCGSDLKGGADSLSLLFAQTASCSREEYIEMLSPCTPKNPHKKYIRPLTEENKLSCADADFTSSVTSNLGLGLSEDSESRGTAFALSAELGNPTPSIFCPPIGLLS